MSKRGMGCGGIQQIPSGIKYRIKYRINFILLFYLKIINI
jgi:hypothetical protein